MAKARPAAATPLSAMTPAMAAKRPANFKTPFPPRRTKIVQAFS
jgi:hypothetical protein